ncbi:phosphotransferase family protein [Algoriphagus namhaensis]
MNIDFAPLKKYLGEQLDLKSGELEIKQFKGGFSNLTFLAQSGNQSFVIRRPPFGEKISKAHDMGREFAVLQALSKAGYQKAPRAVLFCEDESIFGAPFFVMEHVSGLILRNQSPELKNFEPKDFLHLSQASIEAMLELHSLELEDSGLLALGKPEGYVSRQVEGWSKRYFKAKTNEIPEMEEAISWLDQNQPTQSQVGFIHNDFKYDNIVLKENPPYEVKAILDWEMATVGDPLMDLGTTLAYWAQREDTDILKMFNLTHLPGNLTRAEVVDYYSQRSSLDLNSLVFYYVFGLIKVGVIAQQIYKRYSQGHASDPRFAGLSHVVKAAGKQAISSIITQKI